jgi:hypothetical protein
MLSQEIVREDKARRNRGAGATGQEKARRDWKHICHRPPEAAMPALRVTATSAASQLVSAVYHR